VRRDPASWVVASSYRIFLLPATCNLQTYLLLPLHYPPASLPAYLVWTSAYLTPPSSAQDEQTTNHQLPLDRAPKEQQQQQPSKGASNRIYSSIAQVSISLARILVNIPVSNGLTRPSLRVPSQRA